MKEVIYESANAGGSSGRCSADAAHNGGQTKGVAAEWTRAFRLGLQSVPAWHPPVRFRFRDSSGSTRGGGHRRPGACTLARVTAPDSDRPASPAYEYGN